MSERAEELARMFEQVHVAFMDVLAPLSPAQWSAWCHGEERTVAALAHHVGDGYTVEIDAFAAIADGQPVTAWSHETLDSANADGGLAHANCDKAETLQMLGRNAAQAAAFVRSLTDDQLARRGTYIEWIPEMTVDQWIERILIGHIRIHMQSIRDRLVEPVAG